MTVRKRGNKWYYSFELAKVDGKRKRVERVGGNTKKEAQEAERRAHAEYENSGHLFEPSKLSYSDYLDYWHANYVMTNCKYSTQRSYREIIEKHIKPVLGHYMIKTIKPAALQEFLNSKKTKGYSKNYIGNLFGVLSGSLKYAVYPCEFLKKSPMEHVGMPKMPARDSRENMKIITVDEFNRLITRYPEGSTFYVPLNIGFYTGMRVGEVCALQWDDINLTEGTISITKTMIELPKGQYELTTPKTQSSIRSIKIGPSLIKILKKHKTTQKKNKLEYGEHYNVNDFVCTKENGLPTRMSSMRYLNRVANFEMGINFSFHSLRHTHVTLLLEAGANFKHIQKRLGHAKLATTMDIYSHVTDNMITETVELFEQKVKMPTL